MQSWHGWITFIVTVILFGTTGMARGEPPGNHQVCLDQRIDICNRIARLTGSPSATLANLGRLKRLQSIHFQRHKERLIREMAKLDVETFRMDAFLLSDFYRHYDAEFHALRSAPIDSRRFAIRRDAR
jgi:hypothetical protein